jgi:hypothetical protein
MAVGDACAIRLVRRSSFSDRLRSYRILVDGNEVGSIANNSTLDLQVPEGSRTIEARIDWGRSKPMTIVATPNQTIEIEVSNHWGPLLSLWAISFGSGSYLTLKHLPAS